jgi:hypothetical protein
MFERAKAVHALDRAATVIGFSAMYTILTEIDLKGKGSAAIVGFM